MITPVAATACARPVAACESWFVIQLSVIFMQPLVSAFLISLELILPPLAGITC
jgi:hypothetical protein